MKFSSFSGNKGSCFIAAFLFAAFVLLYARLAWLASGDGVWWHISIIGGLELFWGDDSFRYFEALSGFPSLDVLWFNFILPVARLLDSFILFLAQGDLFLSRCIKAVISLGGVVALYFSTRFVGLSRGPAVLAVLLLALHPVQVFIGMSFYGESWLTVMVCVAMFFAVTNRPVMAASIIAFMPLVRPEGIFFVLVFSLFAAFRRHWLLALIPFVPGGLYFFSILLGPGFESFLGWRFVLTEVYQTSGDWFGEGGDRFFRVYYWPWVGLGIAGLFLREARGLSVFSLSVAVYVIFILATALLMNRASFEPRYLTPCLPVLAFGFAVSCHRILKALDKYEIRGVRGVLLVFAFLLCFQAQLRANLAIEYVADYYLDTGRLPVEVRRQPFDMGSWFHGITPRGVEKIRETADVVTAMVNKNTDIKTLLVGNVHVFYFLRPERLRDDVDVVFLAVPTERLLDRLSGNKLAGYFSRQPYGNYIQVTAAQPGEEQILLVDNVNLPDYPLHWQVGQNDIFLFSGGLELGRPER